MGGVDVKRRPLRKAKRQRLETGTAGEIE
jgi:hypothetical protein